MIRQRNRRLYEDFAKDLDEIKVERIKKGVDNKMISDVRLTRGIIRDSAWIDIKRRLMFLPRDDALEKELKETNKLKKKEMNRKGSILDIFVWIAIAFITIFLFVAFLYISGKISSTLSVLPDTEMVNISRATNLTFGFVNIGMASLRWISFLLLIMLGFSILITNFLVKAHPVFFVPYILIVILAAVFSMYISNAYEQILNQNLFEGAFATFTGTNYIFLHLPLFVSVIGIFGAILLFINISRDDGIGGGVI